MDNPALSEDGEENPDSATTTEPKKVVVFSDETDVAPENNESNVDTVNNANNEEEKLNAKNAEQVAAV